MPSETTDLNEIEKKTEVVKKPFLDFDFKIYLLVFVTIMTFMIAVYVGFMHTNAVTIKLQQKSDSLIKIVSKVDSSQLFYPVKKPVTK